MAAALAYKPGSNTPPVVTACGSGSIAREIQRVALRYAVPMHERHALAERLQAVSASTEIPADMYDEVARLLVELGLSE
jgi:flagellar biosynthesis protein